MTETQKPTHNCIKESEITSLQNNYLTLKENQIEIKREVSDMRKVYDMIHELSLTVSVSSEVASRTSEDIKEIKNDLRDIKQKDGKKYNDAVSNIIKTGLTLLLGYLFSKLFV